MPKLHLRRSEAAVIDFVNMSVNKAQERETERECFAYFWQAKRQSAQRVAIEPSAPVARRLNC